ncbi:hypothetical protein BBJ28_00013700 [Nothophytophthora sp. Chile5]|nr:hypothetical protein BBJ28_00013700 [Nothophytophthora sp. Chile5]
MRYYLNCHTAGAVMDNAADSQLVWRQLKTRYPGKFFHGCVSHGLRLLIEDVFGSGRSPEPPAVSSVATPDHVNASGDSHPFSELRQLVENCRVVAMLLQQDEQTSAELTRRLELEGGDSRILQFPRKNDWYRLRSGLDSFLGALGALGRILAEPSFVTEAPIYLQGQRVFVTNTVLHPEFMASLQKAIAILDPINGLLAHFEDAAVPCSEVFASFAKTLPDALSKVVGLTDRERSHLLLLNQSRFNLMYGDAHGIAYLLDPRYVGEGLSVEIRKNIEDLVFDFPLDSPGNGGELPAEASKIGEK